MKKGATNESPYVSSPFPASGVGSPGKTTETTLCHLRWHRAVVFITRVTPLSTLWYSWITYHAILRGVIPPLKVSINGQLIPPMMGWALYSDVSACFGLISIRAHVWLLRSGVGITPPTHLRCFGIWRWNRSLLLTTKPVRGYYREVSNRSSRFQVKRSK